MNDLAKIEESIPQLTPVEQVHVQRWLEANPEYKDKLVPMSNVTNAPMLTYSPDGKNLVTVEDPQVIAGVHKAMIPFMNSFNRRNAPNFDTSINVLGASFIAGPMRIIQEAGNSFSVILDTINFYDSNSQNTPSLQNGMHANTDTTDLTVGNNVPERNFAIKRSSVKVKLEDTLTHVSSADINGDKMLFAYKTEDENVETFPLGNIRDLYIASRYGDSTNLQTMMDTYPEAKEILMKSYNIQPAGSDELGENATSIQTLGANDLSVEIEIERCVNEELSMYNRFNDLLQNKNVLEMKNKIGGVVIKSVESALELKDSIVEAATQEMQQIQAEYEAVDFDDYEYSDEDDDNQILVGPPAVVKYLSLHEVVTNIGSELTETSLNESLQNLGKAKTIQEMMQVMERLSSNLYSFSSQYYNNYLRFKDLDSEGLPMRLDDRDIIREKALENIPNALLGYYTQLNHDIESANKTIDINQKIEAGASAFHQIVNISVELNRLANGFTRTWGESNEDNSWNEILRVSPRAFALFCRRNSIEITNPLTDEQKANIMTAYKGQEFNGIDIEKLAEEQYGDNIQVGSTKINDMERAEMGLFDIL